MRRSIATLVFALMFPVVVDAQPNGIRAALDIGMRGKARDLVATCTAKPGGWTQALAAATACKGCPPSIEQYGVGGTTALARVAILASERKEKYLPAPSFEEATAIAKRDAFVLRITPMAINMTQAAKLADEIVKHVVIRPRGDKKGKQTVQPLSIELTNSRTYENLFGATFETQGVIVEFDSEAVRSIASRKDVEVVIIATGGQERKCSLDDKRIRRAYSLEGS